LYKPNLIQLFTNIQAMRIRFERQYSLGVLPIEDTQVNEKSRDPFTKLILALKYIYTTPEYNEQLLSILEKKITGDKKNTGRRGMNLWQIFVLAITRLTLNISYDRLYHMASYDGLLRQMLGIETQWGYEKFEFEYQNIVDNVQLLDDATLHEINDLIVKMGHGVFKKKEQAALHLKTDSFVVESNVHYPTDYNLMWDSIRVTIRCIGKLKKRCDIEGWRKLKNWGRELKSQMRSVSLSSKKSEEAKKQIAIEYLSKARQFSAKAHQIPILDCLIDERSLSILLLFEYSLGMLDKHIDLFERRAIKGETIPHSEKVFSIFEPYTEWITKGKQNPSFELGKNLQITSDQYHLIVDFRIMENETDSKAVASLANRIYEKYQVASWSFDKGFFSKENKELLKLFVNDVIMSKKGKLNKTENQEEHTKEFKQLRKKHSAVESNINELEHRGLNRCPDRTYAHFKNYVALGICGYNLHKIGAELLRQARLEAASTRREAA